ncbi:MAG TPA: hypothetical protein VFL03_06615 [Candidatus Limnocylindrales bacterium]|jgi:hypothetical protein|nr:hypothetical protein [Candidatus Limnocylindrales bacterium]
MRVHRGLLGWGVFFLVLGAVPLAVRYGVVDASAFDRAWQLWPLLLIGAGLGLVLARTRAAVLGGLVVAVTAGLMVGGLVVDGAGGISFGNGFGSCGGDGGTPFADQRGTLGTEASVSITLDCGELDLAAVDGDRWSVAGSSRDGRPPRIESGPDGLTIASPDRSSRVGLDGGNGGTWSIELPRDARASLDLSVNAGSARAVMDGMRLDRVSASVNAGSAVFDLAGATEMTSFDASVNAGSLSVTLPAESLTGTLSANAGSLAVCVPDDVDLRIRLGDNALGSNNFEEAGLVQEGDAWHTPSVEAGAPAIDLDASANLGSISLNPDDGCE